MFEQFNTGYCTLWWDGVWGRCCEMHDLAYSVGLDKLQADIDLGVCVAQTGNFGMGVIMFVAVLVAGIFFYPRKKTK